MEKEQPEYLYHYTTMSALFAMLNNIDKDDSIKFWASHISYMNDPTEYNFFISALSNAIIQYEKRKSLPIKSFALKKMVFEKKQITPHIKIIKKLESVIRNG